MEIILKLTMIIFASIGTAFFWRTCIYNKGGIFRPIGRLLDWWVDRITHCDYNTFWNRVLRFIAYPLGRCIYCNHFHIAYDIFILANWKLNLGLSYWYMIITIPIGHLLLTGFARLFIFDEKGMVKGDWFYIDKNFMQRNYGKKQIKEKKKVI